MEAHEGAIKLNFSEVVEYSISKLGRRKYYQKHCEKRFAASCIVIWTFQVEIGALWKSLRATETSDIGVKI